MDELTNFLKQAGKEFLNVAGDAAVGAAKEVVGSVINEIFIKKEADTKRVLPSIKNMRVVSITSRISLHFFYKTKFYLFHIGLGEKEHNLNIYILKCLEIMITFLHYTS